jgi:hypothetical protein
MPFSYEEFDLSSVRTDPLESRLSKVRAEDSARPSEPGGGILAVAIIDADTRPTHSGTR